MHSAAASHCLACLCLHDLEAMSCLPHCSTWDYSTFRLGNLQIHQAGQVPNKSLLLLLLLPLVIKYAGLKDELRCYHQMEMPKGLIAVGDSIMTLNPCYGQVKCQHSNHAILYCNVLSCNLDFMQCSPWHPLSSFRQPKCTAFL